MMEKWLAMHGLDLDWYIEHLVNGGSSDGLELWLAMRAMDCPITVIQDDSVFSTGVEGPDFSQVTILMSMYNKGFLCKKDMSDMSHDGQADFLPAAQPAAKKT